ncbi:MAG: GIY-YIG nuclease family protein [Patescibacteria group bacterium]
MYIVYILKCRDGSLYTGITTDVARRLREHKAGKGGNYTRAHGAMRMVYTEKCGSRSAALKREAAIKRLPRAQKLFLIQRRKRTVII